jgi:DNA-binding beta-propeller fold protein YncE
MRQFGAALGLALVLSAALPRGADAATIERTYPVGNEPFGVTIDPADGRIYVANSDRGSSNPGILSVVDPTSPPCSPSSCGVKTIALASPPLMSALDRGLGRLFVTTNDRTLTFVDIATQSVSNTVPNAGRFGVALDEATHHVYASSGTSLSMVDGVTGAVLDTEPAGSGDNWWAVALDIGANRVYVTNLDLDAPSLVILAADDLSFVDEVPLPEVPRLALAVDTARQLVYVGGFSSLGRLYVVDANAREIVRALDLQAGGTFPLSATLVASEDRLYLSHASPFSPNSIVVLDLATEQVVQRIPLSWQPGMTALHADGRLYVAESSANSLAAIRNTSPVLSSVGLAPSAPRTNDTLTATASATDADGDALTYAFTWKVNGDVRSVVSGPSPSSSFDLAVAGNGDQGQTVSVEVVVSDGTQSSVASASVVIANSAPTVAVSLNDTSPQTRDLLVATAVAQDADSDPLTLSYTWTVNGVVRQTGASNTFDLAVKGNGDNGDVVGVTATASDGSSSATASASATVTPGRKH